MLLTVLPCWCFPPPCVQTQSTSPQLTLDFYNLMSVAGQVNLQTGASNYAAGFCKLRSGKCVRGVRSCRVLQFVELVLMHALCSVQ